jgi:RIO-like serine/threonine protein kinase
LQHEGKAFRAFMIEHADGVPLADFTRDECSDDSEMKRIISQAYDELSRHCIVHGEVEERHIFVDKGRMTVKLIDFDWGEISDSEKSAAEQNRVDLEELFAKREKRLAHLLDV